MKQILVEDDTTLLYVSDIKTPYAKNVVIHCEDISEDGGKVIDTIVLLSPEEVRSMILALQAVLKSWGES